MALNTLAIDIGKQSFEVFGIDADGDVISRKVSRAKLAATVERLDPQWRRQPSIPIVASFKV